MYSQIWSSSTNGLFCSYFPHSLKSRFIILHSIVTNLCFWETISVYLLSCIKLWLLLVFCCVLLFHFVFSVDARIFVSWNSKRMRFLVQHWLFFRETSGRFKPLKIMSLWIQNNHWNVSIIWLDFQSRFVLTLIFFRNTRTKFNQQSEVGFRPSKRS